MTLGEMQVDRGFLQIVMPEQDLNGAQIGAGVEQMSGEAMTQGMRMDGFLKAGTPSRLLAGVPRCFGVDRVTGRMPAVAGKEPVAGFSWQSAPMLAQF